MSKGQDTRQRIVARAANLFNIQGFFGSSMSDIMTATGLQKGGIYNHFESKDALALEAFDYAIELTDGYFAERMKNRPSPTDRLEAFIEAFRSIADGMPLPGGCPIMNTAIEADDAHPALREKAQLAMDVWRNLIRRLIVKGISKGELKPNLDDDVQATIMISMLEGAIMLSKLYGDHIHINRVVDYLLNMIENDWRV